MIQEDVKLIWRLTHYIHGWLKTDNLGTGIPRAPVRVITATFARVEKPHIPVTTTSTQNSAGVENKNSKIPADSISLEWKKTIKPFNGPIRMW